MSTSKSAARTMSRVAFLLFGLGAIDTPDLAAQEVEAARTALLGHLVRKGFAPSDAHDVRLSSAYVDQRSRRSYVYFVQTYHGIEVDNALATVVVLPNGAARVTGSRFVKDLPERIASTPIEPRLAKNTAFEIAAKVAGLESTAKGIGDRDEPSADLRFVKDDSGSLRLSWMADVDGHEAGQSLRVWIDAGSGDVIRTQSLVGSFVESDDGGGVPSLSDASGAGSDSEAGKTLAPDSYRVIPFPAESPLHPAGVGTSQADIAYPADPTASPYGWHDTNGAAGAEYFATRGNNVYAHKDDTLALGGKTLTFHFSADFGQGPTFGSNKDAAITNVFYWLNVVHDLTYHYGFDEAAGNFQALNYGGGPGANDALEVEIHQEFCNSDFTLLTADGGTVKLTTGTCSWVTPSRDGAFDNGVTAFLFMMPTTNRLVGGPSVGSCLASPYLESLAVAYAVGDWFGMWMTQQTGDVGSDGRGYGTYTIGQAADGPGSRPKRYSTDFAVNDWTYGDVAAQGYSQHRGNILASMLWDLNWALIGDLPGIPAGDDGSGGGYGYDSDKFFGTGGNNLALQLIIDALKVAPCHPGFVDFRDAILDADSLMTGGANECSIWKSFARRGLGFSADQGLATSTTDQTEAFDLPEACQSNYPVAGKVFLEGPYISGGNMSTAGNAAIPPTQPYGLPPWSYPGIESSAVVPAGVVDWVLLESRAGPSAGSSIDRTVAFVSSDGTLVAPSSDPLLKLSTGDGDSVYVVVRHRNHLDAMTRFAVTVTSDTLRFDLTLPGAAYGTNPLRSLGGGLYGLFAGDGSPDGQVTTADFNLWLAATKAGVTGYTPGDFNLDGQVTTADFNRWLANTKLGAFSKVP